MPQADNTDTSVSEPTEAPAEVDTSTNEDTPDTDVDLESDETSFEDVEDDETEEADDLGESELEVTEPAESEEESKEDQQPESEEETDVADDEPKEEDTPPEDEVKRTNAEMARRRIAEREAREAKQALENQNIERYLDEARDDELEFGKRQLEVEAFQLQRERASLNADSLQNGLEKAIANIELFRTGSPEVKEALVASLDKFEMMHVQTDKQGNPVKVTGDVYEYLQKEADSIERILKTGARTEAKAKNKAKTRTETLPSRAPKEAKVDPDLAAFDEEVAKWE